MDNLYVINCQADQEVHDDNRHDHHEEKKEESCGVLVWHHHNPIIVLGVIKEEIVVLHLTAGHDERLDEGQVKGLEVRLVVEQNKKSKGKGNNEENNDGRNFQKSVAHVNEHHHVDSEERNFSENELEILEIEKKNWNRVKDLKSFIINSLGRVY